MPNIDPFSFRDMSKGRITSYSVSNALAPENSVAHALNVDFDNIIGKAVVRSGTTKLGNTVASNKTPLGLFNFVTSGGASNIVLAVFSGASSATVYYYNGTWNTSGLTTVNNTAKNRFVQLGNIVFMVNGMDAMTSSSDGNTWGSTNCITTGGITPSLIFRTKQRLLAAGSSNYRDRVFFSAVINPNNSPTLTWNTDASTGDWIDINPDDGDNITGFAEVSGVVLVFKSQAMYRLDVVNKTVDTDNVINIGAVSQEAIVRCQGMVYYFSGTDIRRTSGADFPEQISRLGVQDFIDAIPQANWSQVYAWTDKINVYFSIGNVTLNTNKDGQQTFNNVVLKFSPRDQSWTVRSYANQFSFGTIYKTTAGYTLIAQDTNGNVQTLNSGTTDSGTAIFYDLQTQELEFGNRAHYKNFGDKIIVYSQYGEDGNFRVKSEEDNYQNVQVDMSTRVARGLFPENLSGRYFTFRWNGQTSGTPPIFEGFYIESITDKGIQWHRSSLFNEIMMPLGMFRALPLRRLRLIIMGYFPITLPNRLIRQLLFRDK